MSHHSWMWFGFYESLSHCFFLKRQILFLFLFLFFHAGASLEGHHGFLFYHFWVALSNHSRIRLLFSVKTTRSVSYQAFQPWATVSQSCRASTWTSDHTFSKSCQVDVSASSDAVHIIRSFDSYLICRQSSFFFCKTSHYWNSQKIWEASGPFQSTSICL